MWNKIDIQLVNGVGNENLRLPNARLLGFISVRNQIGIAAGTRITFSHLLPNGTVATTPILDLNPIVTPYGEIPVRVPVNSANVAQSNLVYQMMQTINISITGGLTNNIVTVWILTDD